MNGRAVWRIVWKDHRMLRGFWVALFLMALAADAVQWLQTEPAGQANYWFVSFALVAPALFAVACGATLFAAEQEDKTYDFLRGQPIRAWELVAGRIVHTILATVLMAALLWTYSRWLTGWIPLMKRDWADSWPRAMLWVHWGLAAVEGFAWGVLFSVLIRRPLVAACLAIGATSLSVELLAASVDPIVAAPLPSSHYLRAIPRRSLFAAMLLAADFYLVSNWLRGTELFSWRKRKTAEELAAIADSAPRHGRKIVNERERFVVLGRLVWQHVRQSTWPVIGILLAGVLFVVTFAFIEGFKGHIEGPLFVAGAIVAGLLGTYTFLPDKVERRYRFLAERGVRPTGVWFSRQFFGVALALIVMSLIIIVAIGIAGDYAELIRRIDDQLFGAGSAQRSFLRPLESLIPFFVVVLFAYTSGQLCSLLFRAGVIAGFWCFFLTVTLSGWAWLMFFWGINWFWSVFPIPIVLLAASWLRTDDWLLERNSIGNWSCFALTLLLPLGVIFLGMVLHRIFEIPSVQLEPLPVRYIGSSSEEARQTAWMYERAGTMFVPWPQAENELFNRGWGGAGAYSGIRHFFDQVQKEVATWLNENREAMDLFFEATERTSCEVSGDILDYRHPDIPSWSMRLYYVAVLKALDMERSGDLSGAFRWHMAALRYLGHLRMGMPEILQGRAMSLEATVLEGIREWAGLPDQTPDQLRQAVLQLEKWFDGLPPPSDAIVNNRLLIQRFISRDPVALEQLGVTPADAFRLFLLDSFAPWERVRANRLVDYVTWSRLEGIVESPWLRRWVATSEPFISTLKGPWPDPIFLSESPMGELRRRAIRLLLLVKAWQLEHGEYPQDLQAVVGDQDELLLSIPQWFSNQRSPSRFHYLREGFPVPIETHAGAPGVPPGKPIIWSDWSGSATKYWFSVPGSSKGESEIFGELMYGVPDRYGMSSRFGQIFVVP
jgi:hypothetical protein